MMRVLHVIAKLPKSGTELQLVGLIRAARAQGLWEPEVCVLNEGYELAAELRAQGFIVHELRQRRRKDLTRLARLRRVVLSGPYDVVHTSLEHVGVLTRLVSVSRRRPAIVVAERAVEYHRSVWSRLTNYLLRPNADAYAGNSHDVARFIRWAHGAAPELISVVPNGVDPEWFRPRAEHGKPSGDSPLVGYVGRLSPQKGVEDLVAAASEIHEATGASIVIAGEGPCRTSLEERAPDCVQFVGALVWPNEVAAFLRGLDVLVLPSRFEGLPNVVLEARACGVPVVASDVPGTREAIGSGGLLVEPESVSSLRDGVLAALSGEVLAGGGPVPTFEDAAHAHLEVFRAAIRHRARTR